MSGNLAQVLLRIAAAAAPDGGAGVRAALHAALQEKAAFDAGEIVLVRGHGEPLVFPLQGGGGPIVGPDLVGHVLAHKVPYRIDDWKDAAGFAETEGRLRALGLRSALVLPFRFDEPGTLAVAGAVAVARTHGWAFVGASLPLVAPLAGMGGLALDHALRLSALGEQSNVSPSFEAKAEGEPVGEALREAREAGRQLRARLDAAEGRLLEAERLRDDWAQQAAASRTRLEEQNAAIQSLKREIVGARESASSAAEVAEARAVKIRALEAQLQKIGAELRSALRAPLPTTFGPDEGGSTGGAPRARRGRT